MNAASENGFTPLHLAAAQGFTQCCGVLLAAGARLDVFASSGATPQMLVQHLHPTSAELLELLSGRGSANASGTVCDNCGASSEAEKRLSACSGCLVARYCCDACLCAAWPAHKEECRLLQAAREARTAVRIVP